MAARITRRRLLRGMLSGSAITVGLPFLNLFLNSNGSALASGAPLPLRFGSWFWGLGMNEKIFVPTKTGTDFDFPLEIASLAPHRKYLNLFTNYSASTDGKPNHCHYTGWVILRCGTPPLDRSDLPGQSFDVAIADAIGAGTPYRSLDITATGDARDTYSFRGSNAYNVPEVSPADFYRRLFGPQFRNPNAAQFTPDPRLLAEKSVLSAVLEDSKTLHKTLGAEDKIRLDQYFTGVREIENQLVYFLQKPEPRPACVIPEPVNTYFPSGVDSDLVSKRHDLMTRILAMAIACDQTRVFNVSYSNSFAATVKNGYEKGHHTLTHEELVDAKLGYQPMSSWFTCRAMESWSSFLQILADFPEGDGNLLDNSLILAHSDVSYAKTHAINGIPMFTAGTAGGRIRTGLHVDGGKTPATRLPLTAQKLMGLDLSSWGTGSNTATSEISEILV